jgi:hypothetical protein
MTAQPTQKPQYNNVQQHSIIPHRSFKHNHSKIHNSLEHHQSITTPSSVQRYHSIIMCSCSTIKDLNIIHLIDIIRVTEEAIEEVVMEVEDW